MKINHNRIVLSVALLSLLLSGVSLYISTKPVSFKTVAANEIKDSYVTQLSNQAFTEAHHLERMGQFTQAFEAEMQRLSKTGQIILMGEAVLGGGQDISQEVAQNIIRALRHDD